MNAPSTQVHTTAAGIVFSDAHMRALETSLDMGPKVSAFGSWCVLEVLIAMGHPQQEVHTHVIAARLRAGTVAEVRPCTPA